MYRRDFQGNDPIGRDWFADIIDRHKLKVRLKIRKPAVRRASCFPVFITFQVELVSLNVILLFVNLLSCSVSRAASCFSVCASAFTIRIPDF